MRTYLDRRTGITITNIFQGEYHVTAEPNEVISTVLGSCIAVCIRDAAAGTGGMNHFLLPGDAEGVASSSDGQALRFGCFSMEQLVNGILTAGGSRENLEAKVFGGGNVSRSNFDIGQRNASFAFEFIEREGLNLAASDVGGKCARRLRFDPLTGRVKLKRMDMEHADDVFAREVQPRPAAPASDEIELFD